jgi:uncharacterized protein YndB with AHSA1/START domain
MQVEHRIHVAAPPKRIFALYADVANWHQWDPDTKAASIEGPFQTGAIGRLTPTRGNTVPMRFTSVVPDRSFTVESKIPLFCMVFEHELQPTAAGTEVVHRVTFSGALAFLLCRVLGRQLNQGLPVTLARLKEMAQSRSPRG